MKLNPHPPYGRIARLKLMDVLGGKKCNKCSYKDVRALQIDQIDGYGSRDAREKGHAKMYYYYLRNPEEAKRKLQVLCANCNWVKRYVNKENRWKQ